MSVLNLRYTGRDGPTDVLAFPLEEEDYLGEVIISLETCRRQSLDRRGGFRGELALLVIHGVLHLAGHDHTGEPGEGKRMRTMERAVLERMEL